MEEVNNALINEIKVTSPAVASRNRNALKIIAMVTMAIDHIGLYLFPDVLIFRLIGRVSMPIYVFLISEGVRLSKDNSLYLDRSLMIGIWSQIFMMFTLHPSQLNILIPLSLLIGYSINPILSLILFFVLSSSMDYGFLTLIIFLFYQIVYNLKSNEESTLYSVIKPVYAIVTILSIAFTFAYLLFLFNVPEVMYALSYQIISLPVILLLPFISDIKLKVLDLLNRVKVNQALGYLFYPAHLLVIYILTLFV